MKKRRDYARQSAWRKRNPWARSVEFARRRCSDTANKDYPFYGGKGIKVNLTGKEAGKLWVRDNAAAMKCPSLDRVDPMKDYTLKNCRFIEKSVNERLPHDSALRAQVDGEGETLPNWVLDDECPHDGAYAC